MEEEKSFSQRAFSIYTDIRKLQDKQNTLVDKVYRLKRESALFTFLILVKMSICQFTFLVKRHIFDVCTRVWGIGIPIKRFTRRYAVAIKWRYGNTWVDLALIYEPSYIYKRWRGKIQGVREKFSNLKNKNGLSVDKI